MTSSMTPFVIFSKLRLSSCPRMVSTGSQDGVFQSLMKPDLWGFATDLTEIHNPWGHWNVPFLPGHNWQLGAQTNWRCKTAAHQERTCPASRGVHHPPSRCRDLIPKIGRNHEESHEERQEIRNTHAIFNGFFKGKIAGPPIFHGKNHGFL